MTALELYDDLLKRGLQLQVQGDRLLVGPERLVPSSLRMTIKSHAATLKAMLAQGWPDDTRRMLDELARRGA